MNKKTFFALYIFMLGSQNSLCSGERPPRKPKSFSKHIYKMYKENKTLIGLLSSAAIFGGLAYATTKSTQPDRNKILLANAALGGSCGALAAKLDVLEGWTLGTGIMATSVACNSELNKGETPLGNAAWTIANGGMGIVSQACDATKAFAVGGASFGVAAHQINSQTFGPGALLMGSVTGLGCALSLDETITDDERAPMIATTLTLIGSAATIYCMHNQNFMMNSATFHHNMALNNATFHHNLAMNNLLFQQQQLQRQMFFSSSFPR